MTLQAEVDTFLAHVERGDTEHAVASVLSLRDSGMSCRDIVTEVLVPVQLEVGTRWAMTRWSIADEHRATAVVDDVLGALSAGLEPSGRHTMALCSAEGEWHVTPLRMGALVLREHGWRVRLLGASTPAEHVRTTLRHLGADVVAVHCVMPSSLLGVPSIVDAAHDQGLPVLAAGRGFGVDDRRAVRLGCDGWAPDAMAGARLAASWLDTPPSPRAAVPRSERTEHEVLVRRRPALVEEACRLLEERPAVVDGVSRSPADARDDLHLLLDAAATALLVDDRQLLVDLVGWLQVVLVARGVPVAVLTREVEALVEVAAPELPSACALLEAQVPRS